MKKQKASPYIFLQQFRSKGTGKLRNVGFAHSYGRFAPYAVRFSIAD
jgi:hypothetical protein